MQPLTLRSYFKRRIAIALAVVFLCALVFVYAMQITSVLVSTDEAMRARVQYAIDTDALEQWDSYMSRFFSQKYLESGELQKLRTAYENINVTGYVQLASTQWVWTWPWGGSAYVKVHEKVNGITGDVLDEEKNGGIPSWPSGLYALTLEKHKGAWIVTSMQLLSLDPPTPTPQPTPTLLPTSVTTPKTTK